MHWRRSVKTQKAIIEDIYTSEKLPSVLTATLPAKKMMEAEVEMERINLLANPQIASLIEQKRKEGWIVKFVSDMYLDSDFFKSTLKETGIYKEGDEVIVSCEWGARKDDGSLYRKIREKFHPTEWIHYGDNINSDVRMARKNGVNAKHVSVPFLDEEKSIIHDDCSMNYGWQYDYLSGLSRAARIELGETPFGRLAADYVVPILLPYVVNVVRDAESKSIKSLHFLSRDGYIMYEMAKFLMTPSLSINYTFISRRALTEAFLHVCTFEEFSQLYENPELRELSVDELLSKYFELDRNAIEQRFGIRLMTNISDKKDWDLFTAAIFESDTFMKYLRDKTEYQYQITLDYLSKQGIFSPDTAVADIGWLGHTRMMMNAIARSCSKAMPLFYYFCVTDNVLDIKYGSFNVYHTRNKYRILSHTALFESYLCASPYSTTLRYNIDTQGNPYAVLAEKSKIDNTQIWKTNLSAARFIMKSLIESQAFEYISPLIFDRWGVLCIQNLLYYRFPIEYDVFSHAEGLINNTLAKRLSVRDFPFFSRKADFKFADLAITFGYRQAKIIWSMRDLAVKAIGYMYKFLKTPNFSTKS